MAKAKAKSKSKTASKSKRKFDMKNAPKLPNGYKVIGRAPNWDVDKHPVIEGERGKEKPVIMDEGTKKERTVRTFILQDEEIGAVTVWESGMLRDMFDNTEDGDHLRIEYLGLGKAKKGQNAPKLFQCSMKE